MQESEKEQLYCITNCYIDQQNKIIVYTYTDVEMSFLNAFK